MLPQPGGFINPTPNHNHNAQFYGSNNSSYKTTLVTTSLQVLVVAQLNNYIWELVARDASLPIRWHQTASNCQADG